MPERALEYLEAKFMCHMCEAIVTCIEMFFWARSAHSNQSCRSRHLLKRATDTAMGIVFGVGGGARGAAGGGAAGGGGGGFLFDMFYERYADGSSESIKYVGAGMGDIETKLIEVGAGQGSYSKEQSATYGYRCRPACVCCCVFW
ncbi:unnamed protein product, partial [Symbiodinium natans]